MNAAIGGWPQTDARLALLDDARLRPLWSSLPALHGRAVTDATFYSLWVKPGRYFNVCYRLHIEGLGAQLASAWALTGDEAATALRKAGQHVASVECEHCRVSAPTDNISLRLFPSDPRLPSLGRCLSPGVVSTALGGQPISESEAVSYRPGMRCQIRLRDSSGRSLFGKVAFEREPGTAFARHAELARRAVDYSESFQLAAPIAYAADLAMTVVAGVAGEILHDRLRQRRQCEQSLVAAATALGGFHQLQPTGIPRTYSVHEELALVQTWVAECAALFPAAAAELTHGLESLHATAPVAGRKPQLVHRDFYDKQVCFGHGAPTLLDIDTACWGDPEIDLGNFTAHLALRALQSGEGEDWREPASRFLRAYPCDVDPSRVDWYQRATLLRLACGYSLRPTWQHLAPRLRQLAIEGAGR